MLITEPSSFSFAMEYIDSKYENYVGLMYSFYRCVLVHAFSTTDDHDSRRIKLTSGDNRKSFYLPERRGEGNSDG